MSDDRRSFETACEGLVIGHSAFETPGLPDGILRGRFVPTSEYANVAALFRADAVARACPADGADGEAVLRAYYAARDRLQFTVSDANGEALPVEYVHVYAPSVEGAAHEVLARVAASNQRKPARPLWRSRPSR